MRIVCQRCAAAYAIEDRLIGPKGVRAQCPRCRNLQLVHREVEAEPAAAPMPTPALPAEPAPEEVTKTATVPGPPSEAVRLRCLTCGAELEDPFDRALGVCESCRRREVAPREAEPAPEVEPTIAATPPPAPPPTTPRNGAAPKAPSGRYPIAPARISATRPDARLSPLSGVFALPRRPLIAGGAGVIVLAALAVVLFVKPGFLRRREVVPRGLPPAVQAALPAWRMSFVDVAGNAPDYLTEGDSRLAQDMPDAYAEAAEAFQKALILDPRSDAAIAGYVLAIALGQGSTLNDAAFKEASDLVEAAEQRSHRAARPLVAEAQLLLARPSVPGNVDRARALADEAAHAAQGASLRAEALLASGRSFVGTSAEMAGQQLDQALALAPNLKRAYLYRAMSHAAAGRYQEAIADFRKRIALDPEQWEALAGLSALYAEVGDGAQARRVWEGVARDHPDDIRGKLPLAVLSYQLDGKPAAAVAALEALVRARSRYDDQQMGEVLVHLAAAQRAGGDVDAADASAQEALKIRADDPAAHLQAFLIQLDRGAVPAAAKHWPFLVGRLDDSALEKVLEGRLRMAEGRFADAAEAFEKAYDLDPRRLDAAILGGVAAARASARSEAFKDLFAAAHLDPTRSEPRPAVTRFYLQPGESLRGTEGYVIKLASGGDETVAKLDEALILFHHHQLDRADKLLNEVLALDDNNALAHALKSLVVLERGDRPAARSQAELAVRGDRELALAHYARARAALAGGDVDGALRALRETVARAPSFGAATLALAGIEIQRKDLKAARERLMHLVAVDPSYVAAKRALYGLEAPAL